MATLVLIMLLLLLALLLPLPALRDGGRQSTRRARPPSLPQRRRQVDADRMDPDHRAHESPTDRGQQDLDPLSQTPAEAREGELTRKLISGAIDPATYRQRMSDLAHLGPRPDNKHRAA